MSNSAEFASPKSSPPRKEYLLDTGRTPRVAAFPHHLSSPPHPGAGRQSIEPLAIVEAATCGATDIWHTRGGTLRRKCTWRAVTTRMRIRGTIRPAVISAWAPVLFRPYFGSGPLGCFRGALGVPGVSAPISAEFAKPEFAPNSKRIPTAGPPRSAAAQAASWRSPGGVGPGVGIVRCESGALVGFADF